MPFSLFTDLCSTHKCDQYKDCLTVNNKAVCVCPLCNKPGTQVCGSDKKQYLSECMLRLEACTTQKPLHVLKKGACGKYQPCLFTTDTPRKGLFGNSSLHTYSSLRSISTTHNTQLTLTFIGSLSHNELFSRFSF
jgi:hypothetical protein